MYKTVCKLKKRYDSYDAWKKAGGKSMVKRAREKAEEILKEHWPTPLDKDVQREISEKIE